MQGKTDAAAGPKIAGPTRFDDGHRHGIIVVKIALDTRLAVISVATSVDTRAKRPLY